MLQNLRYIHTCDHLWRLAHNRTSKYSGLIFDDDKIDSLAMEKSRIEQVPKDWPMFMAKIEYKKLSNGELNKGGMFKFKRLLK